MIIVDERWNGQHGIGRYSREVLSRLGIEYEPLNTLGEPSSPAAPFRGSTMLRGADLFYSPGYNAFAATKVPQLVTVHDLIHLETPWPGRAKYIAYYDAILRPAIKRAGRVLTVSETSANAIRRWLRDDRVEVINAGNGCSEEFRPDGPKADLGYDYTLYVGNLKPHKNFLVLLDALRLAPEQRLVVVAREAGRVRELAETRGVAHRVEVRSGVDDADLASLYRGARLTVIPSLLEGFGLPALESLSSGTPVVHWAGCESVAEIVGSNGLAVESSSDARAWAQAISGSARQVLSDGRYSWDAVAHVVSQELRDVR